MKKYLSLIILMVVLFSISVNASTVKQNNYENFKSLEQKIANKLDISLEIVDALIDKGFILEEISNMSKPQISKILSDNPILLNSLNNISLWKSAINATKSTAPTGYTLVSYVPNGGGSDEWFHPNATTTSSNINTICGYAKTLAHKVFKTNLDFPSIRYSYYLFGEWGETGYENWCHEGVDLKHATNSTANVYSTISGVVTKSSTSGGYVNIYSSEFNKTVNFQHLSGVDGTGKLLEGEYVNAGDFLGRQNTNDNHVHTQVCSHFSCTTIHSGRDLNLICVKPYGVYSPY